ncbi:protein FAM180A [Alosa sapidissima]|uniref:protein FAM180A n=1 Tax=Alosa sapidissima TaxID=34773 RepID=UPI001C09C380|nr:protein FAM180A [Alosa sapidissima]
MEGTRLGRVLPVRLLVISVFYCNLYLTTASHWSKALYPSAYRVKRGTPAFINPTFQKSVKDINLLYEILISGLHLEEEEGFFSEVDKELASLRRVQTLEVICKDVLPRKLSEIRRLIAELKHRSGPLRREDFERTVLTMVYAVQKLTHTPAGYQRDMWAEALLDLEQAVRQDLSLR